MEIKWSDEGQLLLRMQPWEWDWLRRELRKVPREPIGDAGTQMVRDLLAANPMPAVPPPPPLPSEQESYL